jgi:UDP-N-acetylglucosamine pyrophosphorylase
MSAQNQLRPGHEDVKVDIEQHEHALSDGPVSSYEIQGRFDSLRDLSSTQMGDLNKRVRSKIDWRLMPAITVMFLMK